MKPTDEAPVADKANTVRFGLAWSDNGESCAVAALAHGMRAGGWTVQVLRSDVRGWRTGDYLCDVPRGELASFRGALAAAGLVARGPDEAAGRAAGSQVWPNDTAATPLRVPRIAILNGAACAYPYSGYYAHALASLGLPFEILDGGPIAAGALDAFDLLALPGGFEIWGLDRNEKVPGVDAAIRAFFARGGAALASCGGAFYLSQGRPHWLGIASASPRYSHEYLRSGAGVVSIELADDALGRGLAPVLEMPYYHGPIYEAVRSPSQTCARFCALTLPARMPIDNPLTPERFEREMAGKAAIVTAGGPNRAVLFSAHPEMGDVVRKHIALDSYVAHYLPLRGPQVLEQTLDFYSPNDTPSFRLILNAIYHLCPASAHAENGQKANSPAADALSAERERAADTWSTARNRLLAMAERALEPVTPRNDDFGRLVAREVNALRALALAHADAPSPTAGVRGAVRVLADASTQLERLAGQGSAVDGSRALSQHLLAVELPLRIIEAFARMARIALP